LSAYFRVYSRIDVALDAFPCNGATTTCDALWMGVPVVSLVGRKGSSRAGLSVLTAAGMGQWACHTPEAFIDCAMNLASDIDTLARLRTTLRERLKDSRLMDAAGYAADIERTYRQLWRNWILDK
jgi:predicted O-linked N-acetylglucosamine transferase (SPINDLY family)